VTESKKAVFLSYASEDADAAQRICAALRGAGIEVWFDQSELAGGDAWDRQITRQIRECALFIAVVSAHTDARLEGYFRREWRVAVDRTRDMAEDHVFLLPVVIDDTRDANARVPDKFRDVNWTRLPAGETSTAFVDRVWRLLSPDSHFPPRRPPAGGTAAAGISPEFNERISATWLSKPILLLIGTAVFTVCAFFAVDRFVLSKRSTAVGRPPATSGQSAGPGQVTIPEKSIAVLPFVDMSEKKDQDYFADGMAEEILDLLVKIPNLNVIGRTSSFQFKGRSEDLRAIGEKLGAANLVEGSVRKAGDRIRVTAQLIDAHTGAHRWSDTYDRDFGDVLELQSEIAASIARELQVAVDTGSAPGRQRLLSTEAYTHYLRGRSHYDRLDGAGMLDAQTEFDQALTLDPSFLRAAEGLALAHAEAALNQIEVSGTAWQHAREAADKALRIDANSAPAHAVMGLLHAEYEYDWDAADAELEKALASNPRDPDTLDFTARLAIHRGRGDAALRQIEASLAMDPLNPFAFNTKGVILFLTGDYANAELAVRKSIAISPTFWGNHLNLAWILLERHQNQAALKEAEAETSDYGRRLAVAMAYYALGRKAESDTVLTDLAKDSNEPGGTWPMGMVIGYAYRGETGQAFAWLERAYAKRDPDILLWLRNCPVTASLRGDPRYKVYLHNLNLPE
jgi:TolB-like protein/Tfp pilus assembly protein PilF